MSRYFSCNNNNNATKQSYITKILEDFCSFPSTIWRKKNVTYKPGTFLKKGDRRLKGDT